MKPCEEKVVGAVRFELTTSCTRNKRATRLRYAPPRQEKMPGAPSNCNPDFPKRRFGRFGGRDLEFSVASDRGLVLSCAACPAEATVAWPIAAAENSPRAPE